VLYGVCARAWLESNSHKADLGRYVSLLSYAVGARNHSVAETLASQLPRYDCPILFVGSGHLGDGWAELGLFSTASVPPMGSTSAADCGGFADLVQGGELERLKQTGSRGLLEHFKDRKIGYCCLEARADLLPSANVQQRSAQRYSTLLQAQLGGNADAYIHNYATGQASVSVRPSIQLTTSVLFAKKSGDDDKGNDGKGGSDGATADKSSARSSLGSRLGNALRNLGRALGRGLSFSKHALQRMAERGISKGSVAEAVSKGVTKPGNTPGTTVHDLPSSQSSTGRGVRVVTGSNGTVITVIDMGSGFVP